MGALHECEDRYCTKTDTIPVVLPIELPIKIKKDERAGLQRKWITRRKHAQNPKGMRSCTGATVTWSSVMTSKTTCSAVVVLSGLVSRRLASVSSEFRKRNVIAPQLEAVRTARATVAPG